MCSPIRIERIIWRADAEQEQKRWVDLLGLIWSNEKTSCDLRSLVCCVYNVSARFT